MFRVAHGYAAADAALHSSRCLCARVTVGHQRRKVLDASRARGEHERQH